MSEYQRMIKQTRQYEWRIMQLESKTKSSSNISDFFLLYSYPITRYTWLLSNLNPNPWNWVSAPTTSQTDAQIQTSYPPGKNSRQLTNVYPPLTGMLSKTRVSVESYLRMDRKLRYWIDLLVILAYFQYSARWRRRHSFRRFGVLLVLDGVCFWRRFSGVWCLKVSSAWEWCEIVVFRMNEYCFG